MTRNKSSLQAALACIHGADSISTPRAAPAKGWCLAVTACFGKPLQGWQKLSCRSHKALESHRNMKWEKKACEYLRGQDPHGCSKPGAAVGAAMSD